VVVTSANTVGSKKLPPCAARLPPRTTLAPFLTASAMCASTFSTAFISMSGPDHSTRVEPVGDLHRAGGLGEARGKGVRGLTSRTWITHCLQLELKAIFFNAPFCLDVRFGEFPRLNRHLQG
jgi:hypothetical protein